jgi:hypothetical protein
LTHPREVSEFIDSRDDEAGESSVNWLVYRNNGKGLVASKHALGFAILPLFPIVTNNLEVGGSICIGQQLERVGGKLTTAPRAVF